MQDRTIHISHGLAFHVSEETKLEICDEINFEVLATKKFKKSGTMANAISRIKLKIQRKARSRPQAIQMAKEAFCLVGRPPKEGDSGVHVSITLRQRHFLTKRLQGTGMGPGTLMSRLLDGYMRKCEKEDRAAGEGFFWDDLNQNWS